VHDGKKKKKVKWHIMCGARYVMMDGRAGFFSSSSEQIQKKIRTDVDK
jgi:hypothetical protein